MTDAMWTTFGTFNAKKMSALEVADSFVLPPSFASIAGGDHCYVIGPRGSGKTTLLRMLHGESLMAWRGRDAEALRRGINYSSIFLPADELWASQTNSETARGAFTAQMLYAFVETLIYRTRVADASNNPVHQPVSMSHDQEVNFAQQCIEAWGLERTNPSMVGLLESLDLFLTQLPYRGIPNDAVIGSAEAMSLLSFGVRAFNRTVEQRHHRWALLLDEMELAPRSIHNEVVSFVRGSSTNLILKVSMSPFDRYMNAFGVEGGPIPGHDFQTIYLSGHSRRDNHAFTVGLWEQSLKARGLPLVPLSRALGASSIDSQGTLRTTEHAVQQTLQSAQARDADFARWLRSRKINLHDLSSLSYNQRSATIRKVYPLLVFRDAVTTHRQGKPVRRTRKKSLEPFTGASAVVTALEGNPRWIKTAFAQMLDSYDERSRVVSPGFQFDALSALAARFESLLRVLPRRQSIHFSVPVAELVDSIAVYLSKQNTAAFTPDPQNCFTVDADTPEEVLDALVMGLYAGAFVHVRDRRSPAVLSDFVGQRFRLAYLLGVRDGKEFPLRLGKDVKLSVILAEMAPRLNPRRAAEKSENEQLDLEFN